MLASEAAPFAKTGGLSDVVGVLPGGLTALGHQVAVLLPRYSQTRPFPMRRVWGELPVTLNGHTFFPSLFQSETDEKFLFLDLPELYERDGLYGDAAGDFPDNDLRFALLSRAAFEVARYVFAPDILHCHDWQAGLAPLYLRRMAYDPTFAGVKSLLTIHNLGYQGLFPPAILPGIGLDASVFNPNGIEFWGQVNYLKAGLVYADALSTVSRKYAEEIQTPEYGFGLDGLLRSRAGVLTGILNGADYSRWNPETDPHLAANYSPADLAGKRTCKASLLAEFGLPTAALNKPLIGIVSRFTSQKGADLIADAASELFQSEDVYLAALGNGEPVYEELFRGLAERFPGRVAVYLGYNDALAHRIEAGSDIFLMPSRYEPCGLNQIYSLKYGTVPVVRATGGLDDTIDTGTGFKFESYTGAAMLQAVRTAIAAFSDRKAWTKMMLTGMSRDFSWAVAAAEYSALYDHLLNPKPNKTI